MYLRAGILALCAVAVQAQRPEDAVVAALRQLEKAEQTGDADTWMALQSSRSGVIAHPEAKSIMSRPNPSAHYGVTRVLVDGDRAALIGTMRDQFLSVRFVLENAQWKILDTTFSNVPIDPASLYALIPPADGAFVRAGSPWDRVQTAIPNARYFKA